MKFSTITIASIVALGISAIPSPQSDAVYITLRSLPDNELHVRYLDNPYLRSAISRRGPFPSPLARPKGGGGGRVSSTVKNGNKGKPGSSGSPAPNPPPGLSPDGLKAFNDCNKAQASMGDCSAMRGPFAEMGCSLGSIHIMKPCENKNLQQALSKEYCKTNPKGKDCK
ncbi:hypothetical protein MMC14_004093 [Varicellaria rhodocarpa]|nr:hypothetical protein [Varicellaria rhodocarpa]